MEVDKKLYAEIKEYCKLNGLKIGEFINKLIKDAFLREKYGELPPFLIKKQEDNKKNEQTTKVEEKIITEPEKVEEIIEVSVPKKPRKRNLY